MKLFFLPGKKNRKIARLFSAPAAIGSFLSNIGAFE